MAIDYGKIGENISEALVCIGDMFVEGAGAITVSDPIFVFPGDGMGVRALLAALRDCEPSVGEMNDGLRALSGAMWTVKRSAVDGEPVALVEALKLAGESRFAQVLARELALDSDGMITAEMLMNMDAAVFVAELSMRLVAGRMLREGGDGGCESGDSV